MKLMTQISSRLAWVALFAFTASPGISAVAETTPKARKAGDSVSDFALIDHRGEFRHLHYYAKDPATKAIVLFVQGNGCPLVRQRIPKLKRLRDAYATNGVVFWMLNANPQDHREDVVKEAAEFGIDFPILMDETQYGVRQGGNGSLAHWPLSRRGPAGARTAQQRAD